MLTIGIVTTAQGANPIMIAIGAAANPLNAAAAPAGPRKRGPGAKRRRSRANGEDAKEQVSKTGRVSATHAGCIPAVDKLQPPASHRGMQRLLATLVVFATLTGSANAACTVARRAEVPLRVVAGVPVVAVEVNDTTLPFVPDTGAERSLVTEETVERAGLRLDEWASTTVQGVSGYVRHRNADPTALSLGGIPLRRRSLAADQTLTVGPLPQAGFTAQGIAGLLGSDFLSVFDLDLDIPHQRLALYRVEDCAGRFLPWTGDYDAIPAIQPIRGVLIIPVMLDGIPLRVEIDSGASVSILTATGMFRMGLTPEALARDPGGEVTGIGRFAVAMRLHRFKVLEVGKQHITDPELWAAPVHGLPIVDLLLGRDWLRRHRVWLSYATSRVFVAD